MAVYVVHEEEIGAPARGVDCEYLFGSSGESDGGAEGVGSYYTLLLMNCT